MSNQTIFDALVGAGMTVEGACGMLGNMAAESGMNPLNVEDRSGINDVDYVFRVDNDPTYDFATDYGKAYGFGLCQWTHYSRKSALLAFAKSRGVSVGDGGMQTQFCIKELKEDYPDLWAMLCSSHDLMQCTQRICTEFERPAVNNVGTRLEFAKQAFDYFTAQPRPADKPPDVETDGVTDPVELACDLLLAYLRSNEFQEGFSEYVKNSLAMIERR